MSQGVTASNALVPYQAPLQQKEFLALDPGAVSAEEVGQLIHHLQEEINIIK